MNVRNNFLGTGRIANDMEIRSTESGRHVVNFNLAIGDGTKEKPHTTFIPCEAWEGTADTIAKYFKKGDQIIIGGRLITRKVVDRGENRYRVAVSVESFEFGQKKKEETKEAVTSYRRNDIDTDPYIDDDQPW